jgi:hypothetical protein
MSSLNQGAFLKTIGTGIGKWRLIENPTTQGFDVIPVPAFAGTGFAGIQKYKRILH